MLFGLFFAEVIAIIGFFTHEATKNMNIFVAFGLGLVSIIGLIMVWFIVLFTVGVGLVNKPTRD